MEEDTFPNIIKNLSSNPTTSERAELAVSGNNVHVVWENGFAPPGNRDIFHRRSLDGGRYVSQYNKEYKHYSWTFKGSRYSLHWVIIFMLYGIKILGSRFCTKGVQMVELRLPIQRRI